MPVVVTPPLGLTTIPAGFEVPPPVKVTVPVLPEYCSWPLKPELSAAVVVPGGVLEVIGTALTRQGVGPGSGVAVGVANRCPRRCSGRPRACRWFSRSPPS